MTLNQIQRLRELIDYIICDYEVSLEEIIELKETIKYLKKKIKKGEI